MYIHGLVSCSRDCILYLLLVGAADIDHAGHLARQYRANQNVLVMETILHTAQ
jgi:hypothetical protein